MYDPAKALLDAMPDAALLLRADGIVDCANTIARDLLTTPGATFAGAALDDFLIEVPSAWLAGPQQWTSRLARDQAVQIEFYAAPLELAGEPLRLVTVRRQDVVAQESGSASEAPAPSSFSDAVIEALPQAVLVYDAGRRVAGWNARLAALDLLQGRPLTKGMPIAEVYGAIAGPRFVTDERLTGTIGQKVDALFSGESQTFELRLKERVYISMAGPTPDGGAIIALTDVSEARQSASLLRMLAHGTAIANESQDVVDAVNRCIAVVCAEGRWVTGHAYLRDTESGEEVLRSTGFGQAPDSGDLSLYRDATERQIVRVGERTSGRTYLTNEPVWFEDFREWTHLPRASEALESGLGAGVLLPIRSSTGVVGVFEVAGPGPAERDDLMIDVLLQLGGQIGRVFEREQANNTLRAARELAEEAAAAKSQFLANMSHEIRTPLNVINGFSELGLRTTDAERLRRYIEMIHSSSQDLASLVDDILDISRIDAGRIELENIDFRLDELFEQVAGQVSVIAADKGLALNFTIAGEVPLHLSGDPLRLRQVLMNLCSNAVKFTDDGAVSVGVRLLGLQEKLATLHFEVTDTGTGIATEHIDSLFNLFSQVDSSTTRRHGGSGLGLAICRQLVELMKGAIDVDSTLGRGSRFHFTVQLPIIEMSTESARLTTSGARSGSDLPRAKENDGVRLVTGGLAGRVLLVEDNELNQKVAAELLETLGLQVQVASSGREAVAMLERDAAFSLILMDMQMPEMDGLSATRIIQSMDVCAGVPIVAMTANVMAEDYARYEQAGIQGVVAKPVELAKLDRLLHQLMTSEDSAGA